MPPGARGARISVQKGGSNASSMRASPRGSRDGTRIAGYGRGRRLAAAAECELPLGAARLCASDRAVRPAPGMDPDGSDHGRGGPGIGLCLAPAGRPGRELVLRAACAGELRGGQARARVPLERRLVSALLREQRSDPPRDLEVLARPTRTAARRRRRPRLGVRRRRRRSPRRSSATPRKPSPARRRAADRGRVLADAAGEDERVEPAERRRHRARCRRSRCR